MIGLGFYNSTPTSLDLNGPFLRFTSEPESETVNDGGGVTLSGIATAEFKGNPSATNTGSISYQWYLDGAALNDGSGVSGSGTNELTLSNLSSPTDSGKSLFLRAEYVPSAYQSEEGAVTAGIARSTGFAPNAPVDTTNAIITINPTITINTQPQDATAAQGQDAVFTIDVSTSDSSDVTYQWNVGGSPVSDSSTVSGSNTPTLTLSDTNVGTQTVSVTVTHPTAGNSPVTSDDVDYVVVSARSIVSWDIFTNDANYIGGGSKNLFEGSQTLSADSGNVTRGITLSAPEKDTKVRFTMKGASGGGRNGNRGGEGGQSVFEFTLTKGVEHYIALGAATLPTGGTNGGGGAAYMYRKGRLIVAIGGGGGAGNSGRGGDGGGIGVAGENGQGRSGGSGGSSFPTGTLPTTGVFPGGQVYGGVNWTAPTGGRASGCPMGSAYYRDRYGPCDDVGTAKFRTTSGSEISQTASIERGYKPGIGHRNNGGNGSGGNGGGASGAAGGNSGNNDSGGGGASGYSSGDVTIISTQRGGNSSQSAFITMEYVV